MKSMITIPYRLGITPAGTGAISFYWNARKPQPKKTTPNFSKVHYEKVTIVGVKLIRITGFNNVKRFDDLPEEYTDEAPCYFMAPCGAVHVFDRNQAGIIRPGSMYTPAEFDDIIKSMKISGKRLGKILIKNRHSGHHTVEI